MIPWWVVVLVVVGWGLWTVLCIAAGIAWANVMAEKESVRRAAEEQAKWTVPGA